MLVKDQVHLDLKKCKFKIALSYYQRKYGKKNMCYSAYFRAEVLSLNLPDLQISFVNFFPGKCDYKPNLVAMIGEG